MLTLLFPLLAGALLTGVSAAPSPPQSYNGAQGNGHWPGVTSSAAASGTTPTTAGTSSVAAGTTSVADGTTSVADGTTSVQSGSRTTSGTFASPTIYHGNETYSDGTTRSLASCAASMNGSIPSSLGWTFDGTIRRYYVAAEEVEWDFAPTGWDNWLGVCALDFAKDSLRCSCCENRFQSAIRSAQNKPTTSSTEPSTPKLCTEVTPTQHSHN